MPFFSRQALLPLLPQNDPNPQRAKDLAIAQGAYIYNYTYIPKLPMAQSVPKAGLFHSKEGFKEVETLSGLALSLSHIHRTLVTIQIECQITS
jgi:hypothetical protein